MTESEFIERWNSERPSYLAWGFFVRDSVEQALLLLDLTPSSFLKIPAVPRLKEDNSLLGKAFHRGKNYSDPYHDIEDKVGIRFVVLLTAEIQKVSNVIESSTDWTTSLDKDFEADRVSRPLEFAYQSKHYVVRAARDIQVGDVLVHAGTPCEVQIRTLLQHAHSELTHDNIYKRDPNTEVSKKVERTVAKSMALIEAVDDFFAQALAELERASEVERRTLSIMGELYLKYVGRAPLIDKTNAIVLGAFRGQLTTTLREDIVALMERYDFIGQRISDRFDTHYTFRQPWILLAYLLVASRPNLVRDAWPLTMQEIEPVFTDMGKSVQ
ncbi:MAG: GTP pyrophosphokinase [Burkholderiales bacterium]